MLIAMSRSKSMKKSTGKKRKKPAAIALLPNELVIEVLARVAASSSTDFFNAKQSCKIFHEVADDRYIYQQASLENIPSVPWHLNEGWYLNEGASTFLEKCKESGNPETLYRQGVVEYFSRMKLESGLDCLMKAANSGHMDASYVLGIILLCGADEKLKQQGIQLLEGMRKCGVTRVGECRKRLKPILWSNWINNKLNPQQQPTTCKMQDQHKRRKGWDLAKSDEEDDLYCEACRFDCEVISFCNILHRDRIFDF